MKSKLVLILILLAASAFAVTQPINDVKVSPLITVDGLRSSGPGAFAYVDDEVSVSAQLSVIGSFDQFTVSLYRAEWKTINGVHVLTKDWHLVEKKTLYNTGTTEVEFSPITLTEENKGTLVGFKVEVSGFSPAENPPSPLDNSAAAWRFQVREPTQPQEVEANIDIDPDTLNLKSKGKWVTAYIEIPENYGFNIISPSSVKITEVNGVAITPISASSRPTAFGDYDSDGIPDLMVKFSRSALAAVVPVADAVKIAIEGELTDGTQIKGSDEIRVIKSGKEDKKEKKQKKKEEKKGKKWKPKKKK